MNERDEHDRQVDGGALDVEVAGETLRLLPQRCAFWPRQRLLLVADMHPGKAASFARLTQAIAATGAIRVAFLGDFLALANEDAMVQWRRRHLSLELLLVRGTQHATASVDWAALGVEVQSGPVLRGPFALVHSPEDAKPLAASHYGLAGQLHPVHVLHGQTHERVRVPCFRFTPDHAILPTFGAVTGGHPVQAFAGDRVFLVSEERIVALQAGPAAVN